MSNLDFKYITCLVRKTQTGDGNAFAELFAATYEKQYAFAYGFLKDTFLAQQALKETYIYALNNVAKIQEASLVSAWLNQIIFRICFRIRSDSQTENKQTLENQFIQIGHENVSIRRALTLPFTEAQSILLHFYCGMKRREIADLLEIRRSAVRQYIRSGVGRLNVTGSESA